MIPRPCELAKMDGAIILSLMPKILYANCHNPDPMIPTFETRTAIGQASG